MRTLLAKKCCIFAPETIKVRVVLHWKVEFGIVCLFVSGAFLSNDAWPKEIVLGQVVQG